MYFLKYSKIGIIVWVFPQIASCTEMGGFEDLLLDVLNGRK